MRKLFNTGDETANISNKIEFQTFYRNYGYLVSFVLLTLIALYFNKDFLSVNSIFTLLNQTAVKGVISIGLTFAITCGMFDLSLGSQVGLISGLSVIVYNTTQSVFIMLVFCVVLGCILGSLNGVFVSYLAIPAFIATLATQSAYRSIILQLGKDGPFEIDRAILSQYRKVATGKILGIPNLVLIFFIVTAIAAVVLNRTKFGRYVTAVGSNPKAAELAGINVKLIRVVCYIITGAMAGLSAFIMTARLTSITAANAGLKFEFDGVAAVAIGGTAMGGGRGRIIGTFFGIIMFQMIETILVSAAVPPFLNGLVQGTIIIIAVLMQGKKKTA